MEAATREYETYKNKSWQNGKPPDRRQTHSGRRRQNLMLVARENGIFIPSLCYYEHIEPPLGSCRVCTCKLNGKAGPACTEKVSEGLVVEVNTA